MPKFIDLTGQRFGRWTVVRYEGKQRFWCRCDCGTERSVSGEGLRRGESQSCGCLWREHHMEQKTKHGDSYTILYKRWKGMRNRCNDPKAVGYHNYGGRGIKICDEWNNDYLAFKKWALANGFEEHLTLDRIDNDGDYSPENCRWVTRAEQARNRRDTRRVTINGETRVAIDWAKDMDICYMSLLSRLNSGWTDEQAVLLEKKDAERDAKTGRFLKRDVVEVL